MPKKYVSEKMMEDADLILVSINNRIRVIKNRRLITRNDVIRLLDALPPENYDLNDLVD